MFQATLLGSAELTVIDANARATAFLELRSDGLLSFALTGQTAWVPAVTMLHIHSGTAGVNGPIVVDLLSDGATFDIPSRTIEDTFSISATLAAQIAAAPQNFYFNVHTPSAPIGLARGQLSTYAPLEFHAFLSGSEETPPNVSGSRGAASVRVTAARTAEWVAALTSPSVVAVTLGHVHVGNAGIAGPILIDFAAGTAAEDIAAGTLSGSVVAIPLSTMSRVAFDPAGFYVNLHTAAFPNGVARGQLATGTVGMWAPLRGDEETNPITPAARGGTSLLLESTTAGRAILAVPQAQGIANITLAHVHVGIANTDGPIVIDLMAGADFGIGASTGSAEGSITYNQMLFTRLLAEPGRFYSNYHSAAAPLGLVRGQLSRTPQTFVATLTGAAEVPPATIPGNSGRAHVIVTDVHACSFSIEMAQPVITDVQSAHVHDGGPTVNGPILIGLLDGSFTVSGDTINGSTIFTGRTFSRLLADASAFYVNVHTAAEPNGAARGQLLLLTEDTPPAGLVYDTPKTYLTGAAIENNVPDSIGGAITSYSVAPGLPAGLTLNTTTGILSGTPTLVTAAADYVVTATNSSGFTTATIHITVDEGPPLTLAYATPVVYVVGTPISDNAPTFTGGTPTLYVVDIALPSGLSLSSTTGVISGTPDTATSAADYVITASNSATGTAQATVNIRVDATLLAPDNLTYSENPATYSTGHTIDANTPTIEGGAVETWSISPALPAGLSFNTTTGVITGTPTTITTAADYEVTATNDTGSTSVMVNIGVVLGAPKDIAYDYSTGVGYVNPSTFTTMTPTVGGGTPTSWAITGTLPAGLSFSTSTGVISGSPSATANTQHNVTATNSGGTSASVQVTIIVYP